MHSSSMLTQLIQSRDNLNLITITESPFWFSMQDVWVLASSVFAILSMMRICQIRYNHQLSPLT